MRKEQCCGFNTLKSEVGLIPDQYQGGRQAFITKLENLLLENFDLCNVNKKCKKSSVLHFFSFLRDQSKPMHHLLFSVDKEREAGILPSDPCLLIVADGKELNSRIFLLPLSSPWWWPCTRTPRSRT